jgi:hypothetical protein
MPDDALQIGGMSLVKERPPAYGTMKDTRGGLNILVAIFLYLY